MFASTELAAMWQLPSIDYATVPFARSALPVAPAPAGDLPSGRGTGHAARLRSGRSRSIRRCASRTPPSRATVEQGKSSYLVATVAEDLRRERCAVIVLDPKGMPPRRPSAWCLRSGRARCSTSRTRHADSTRSPWTPPPT